MAVDIPVVVDIEKAFTEAAKRVSSAIQPMKRAIEQETAKIKLTTGTRWDDLTQAYVPVKKSLEDIIGLTQKVNKMTGTVTYSLTSSTRELATALEDARQKYMRLTAEEEKGIAIDYRQLDASREAITILTSEIAMRQRKLQMVEQSTQREIAASRAIEAGNYALQQEVKTAADLNSQISALRGKLQNLDPKSKEWTSTAKEIKKATAKLEEYNAKLNAIMSGTSTRTSAGSINRISKEMGGLIAKWNSMSASVKFDANGQLSAKAQALVDKYRALTAESERYGRSLQETAKIAVPSINSISQKLSSQSGIFRMLTSYMSIYTAIFAGLRFVRNVRETTAEFEMQRVALGGIIQDAEKANSLFREIKAAAIESPFQIKDLVKYTKQLSAYRIETENLFKVTMKLADVSAGLGVDMNRLILAYGQVRAASVLRGQELRQFTEAGIPMVELLAKKFNELGREGTTTADVFELISKRAVPFSMIADIFDDMTERGGVFYKMQEKQAETLKGQWSNLKDSLSIMYDEIGNTKVVHGAMSTMINDAKFLFQNWRYIANAIKISTESFLAFKVVSLFLPNLKRELLLSKKAQDAFTRSTELATFAQQTGSKAAMASSARLKAYATYMQLAAVETNFFKRAWLQLKATMAATSWISLLLTLLSALATVFISMRMESGRLAKELEKIGAEGQTSITRSISNFKRLADVATSAADGSKEQADAVAELKRTYGDIIPTQDLEAAKLKELRGDYDALTAAIRQKISEQIREQKVNTITDEYGKTIGKKQKAAKDLLSRYGLDKEQINAILSEIQSQVEDGLISIQSTAEERREVFQKIIRDLTGFEVNFRTRQNDFDTYVQNTGILVEVERRLNLLTDDYLKMDSAIKDVNSSMETSVGTFGKFAKMSKQMEKDVANVFSPEFGDSSTYAAQQQRIKQTVMVYWDYIQKAFEEANKTSNNRIDIGRALLGDGKIDFGVVNEAVKEAMAGGKNTRLNTFINSIQQEYERLVPSDRIVNLVREKVGDIAEQFSVPMEKAHVYFKDSETSMEDWVKSLQEAQKEHESLYKQMVINNQEIEHGNMVLKAFSESEVEAEKNMNDFLTALISFFSEFKKHQKGPAYQQDPFISQMQDRMKFMQDFKKGYDDLNKYISSNDALSKVSDKMAARGLAIGIDEAQQKRAAKELSEWYDEAMEEAFKAAKKYGASGTIRDFLSKPITDKSNRGKALKEFQNLIQSLFDAKTDIDISNLKKNLEDALNMLKDEIKRSEAARNFFQSILDTTGDRDLALAMSVSVYGDIGNEFKERMQKQLEQAFSTLDQSKISGDLWKQLNDALAKQDFNTILKHIELFPEEWQKILKQMADDDEKHSADLMKNFADLISKYGDTAQKIATIKAKADNEIQKVKDALDLRLTDTKLTPEQKQALKDRADEIIKALEATRDLDIFKQSDRYIDFFAEINLMTAAAAATVRGELRKAFLKAFHDGAISADELRKNLRAVDEQFRKLSESTTLFGAYLNGGLEGANKKLQEYSDNVSVLAAKMKSGKVLSASEQNFASKMLSMFGSGSTEGIKSYQQLISAFSNNGGLEAAGEAFGEMGEGMSAMAANGPGAIAIVDAIIKAVNSTITGIQQIIDQLNEVRGEDKKIGKWFRFLGDFNKYAFSGWEKLKSGDVIGAVTDTVSSIVSIFNNVQRVKVDNINKKIEEQVNLIDDLEYAYSRLEKALGDSFGSEYIYNYNKQLEILKAKVEAYKNQAELERSKGKSADEKVAKGYDESAREIQDQITDMQGRLHEFFAGTDLSSAAEDFANAWIEAYKEFGSTTDAMSEKFNDMINRMINRSLSAKIMQEMLQPIFDQIDEMSKDGLLSVNEIALISQLAQERIPLINDAMTNLMSSLAAAGLDVRTSTAGLHGIGKEISGASEESILALAAGINTQNFYMSYMPTISENVSQILAAMTGTLSSTSPVETTENGDVMPSIQKMVYDYLPTIDQRLMNIESLFKSVVTSKSGTSTNTNCVAVR